MRTTSRLAEAVLIVCFVTVGACSPEQPPSVPEPPVTTTQLSEQQSHEACAVSDDGGTYYLWVTSDAEGDLSACDGAPRVGDTVDSILNRPGSTGVASYLRRPPTRRSLASIATPGDQTLEPLAHAAMWPGVKWITKTSLSRSEQYSGIVLWRTLTCQSVLVD